MTEAVLSKILVIDDEPALRELLVDVLSSPHVQVQVASSGAEAISLAREFIPDLVVADLYLGDCTGPEVIDALRHDREDLPAVVITGSGDVDSLAEASQRRPIELMTKPLDLDRLRQTVHAELNRQADAEKQSRRSSRARSVAKAAVRQRRVIRDKMNGTCEDLATAYRNLSGQMGLQKALLEYQRDLLSAQTDDDVFRNLFRLFVRRSGPVFGAALVCDSNAQLNVVGRFGVPAPDSVQFCGHLCEPMIDAILATPECILLDAGDEAQMFDQSIHRYLPGLTVLAIPLIPAPGELIGLVMLYRKGEQPFTDSDIAVAELIGSSTAIAVRRND